MTPDVKEKSILVTHFAEVRLVGTVADPVKSPPCLVEQGTVPAVKEMIVAIVFQQAKWISRKSIILPRSRA
jgi:hypothetical protein